MNVDKRLKEFNEAISKNEEKFAANVESVRTELARLQKRNKVTALADRAITDGDVEAYRQLETLMRTSEGADLDAVASELFRVFQAYSIFSGVSRTASVELPVSRINSSKTKEEELEIDDLLPLLKMDNPVGRAKVAELISKKAKHGSYKTAETIADTLKHENHLEVHRILGSVFRTITGYQAQGKLDDRELLQWWEENKTRLKKEDTDVSPTPTPQPSMTAAKTP